MLIILLSIVVLCSVSTLIIVLGLLTRQKGHLQQSLMQSFDTLRGQLSDPIKQLSDTQREGEKNIRMEILTTLKLHHAELQKEIVALIDKNDRKLQEISGQVEKRLSDGFEKTTTIFQSVLTSLGKLDEAQKNIVALSSNVVSLQDILSDKRSRGAFGEVQLNALIRNMIPESHFQLQSTLSTGARVDCLLLLPEPTGNMAIDSKFPLESYQQMMDVNLPDMTRKAASGQFKKDIKKHIQDIAKKYIVPNETTDSAMMFIPSEAIFAEIHAHHPDLVVESHAARIWLVSPTTMMAILTTIRSVLKDDATKKQVGLIQQYLKNLHEDFKRFKERMDKLATHIKQANDDVMDVNTSAKKMTSAFEKIERVELHALENEVTHEKQTLEHFSHQ
jgi:DNA recombination protein RmuC